MKYVYPVNTIHDAAIWIVHKALFKDNYFPEVLKYMFCDKVRLVTGDALGCEIVAANAWKGKDAVFDKATKWDFKNGLWVWDD